MVLWNASGIKSRCNKVLVFVSEHSTDVLLITDTHLRDSDVFYLSGYQPYRADLVLLNEQHASVGAAIFVRRIFTHRRVILNTTLEAVEMQPKPGGARYRNTQPT